MNRSAANRRSFLRTSGLATLAAALGGPIPFARNLAPGLFPDALAQTNTTAKPCFSCIT